MVYTVQQLASLAGVSVRTLHHYDQIGLLKPSFIKENGYRYYEEKELIALQQILFFRELDFPLDHIKSMIQSKDFNVLEALKDQRRLLEMEQKRLKGLIVTISQSIDHMKNNTKMKDTELYGGLTKQQIEGYKEEVRQKWGESALTQSEERMKDWSKADYDRVAEQGKQLTQLIADNRDKGFRSPEVQTLIAQHFAYINKFYDCSYEIYRGLGKLYVQDQRFTAYYENISPGLAQFMHDAMMYFCQQQEK